MKYVYEQMFILVLLVLLFIGWFMVTTHVTNKRKEKINRTSEIMYEYSDKPGVLYTGIFYHKIRKDEGDKNGTI